MPDPSPGDKACTRATARAALALGLLGFAIAALGLWGLVAFAAGGDAHFFRYILGPIELLILVGVGVAMVFEARRMTRTARDLEKPRP